MTGRGYRVINLGIEQPSDVSVNAARANATDAIGVSGLLVKSTLKIKYVLQDRKQVSPKIPAFQSVQIYTDSQLDDLFPYWNEVAPFKNRRQLETVAQGDDLHLVEEKYRPTLKKMHVEVKTAGRIHAKSLIGFYPWNSQGDDVLVNDPVHHEKAIERLTFPMQATARRLSIALYFTPSNCGKTHVIAFTLVTTGDRASVETQKLFEAGDFTRYLYLYGLFVETAKTLAEFVHKQTKTLLGIASVDSPKVTDLFHQKYRSSRYSLGDPACSNFEAHTKLFRMLEPEKSIGVRLPEGYHLEPEQSTNALVVRHPQAKYCVA